MGNGRHFGGSVVDKLGQDRALTTHCRIQIGYMLLLRERWDRDRKILHHLAFEIEDLGTGRARREIVLRGLLHHLPG